MELKYYLIDGPSDDFERGMLQALLDVYDNVQLDGLNSKEIFMLEEML